MTTPAGSPGESPLTPRGVRALTEDEFSLAASVGGWRGLVESVLPGLVFVVVYVATRDLRASLIASLGVAAVAVVVRLLGRTPPTQAFGGVLGVVIGAIWAWRSGQAEDYFAWGLWVNGGFALGVLVSILARWPVVGLLVSLLRLQSDVRRESAASPGADDGEAAPVSLRPDGSWRSDRLAMRRYTIASWLWFAAFMLRLAVQIPLYYSAEIGWLGTARLVMGLPLWALVLWLTWVLVRPLVAPAAREPHDPRSPAPPTR